MSKNAINLKSLENMLHFAANSTMEVDNEYLFAETLYNRFKIREIHSAYVNNFKDALMHYRKMHDYYQECCKLEEENKSFDQQSIDFISQFHLFIEHINRAVVDVYVELMQRVAVELMDQLSSLNELIKIRKLKPDKHSDYMKFLKSKLQSLNLFIRDLRLSKLHIGRMIHVDLNSAYYMKPFFDTLSEVKTLLGATQVRILFECKMHSDINALVIKIRDKRNEQYSAS